MCSRVDQPGSVKGKCITEEIQEHRVREGLAKEVHRDNSGHNEAHKRHESKVVLLLESEDRISIKIAHVNIVSFLLDVRMLAYQQPTNMSEEESTSSIVWVSICLRVFVVHTMVSSPINNCILESQCVAESQEKSQRPFCFVGLMCP